MIGQRLRWFSSLFLLLLFLGAKSLEFHAAGHSDEDRTPACEWCDHALLMQATPLLLASETTVLPLSPSVAMPGKPLGSLPGFAGDPVGGSFFCRPPPAAPRA